jgi:hypothetical protein
MAADKNHQEHPLANVLVNVLIPVLALSYLSKDPEFQRAIGKAVQPWHIGPVKALMVALAFPIAYGIRHFIKTRKANFFSALGLFSVLLTGGLTIFLWNEDGTIKPNGDVLFGLKEASIPLILGIAVIGSHFTSTPLIRTFLYSDTMFDIARIEKEIDAHNARPDYVKIIFQATLLFAASFFISALLNFGLAVHFLGDLDPSAPDARVLYNGQVAKLTGWGFAVIGLPMLIFLFITLRRMITQLSRLTGLKEEEIMLPR